MPNFNVAHLTRVEGNQTILIGTNHHMRVIRDDATYIIGQGNVWDGNGQHVIPPEEWPDALETTLKNLNEQQLRDFGFRTDEDIQADDDNAQDDSDELETIVREQFEEDHAWDDNGRLSINFFSDKLGRRVSSG